MNEAPPDNPAPEPHTVEPHSLALDDPALERLATLRATLAEIILGQDDALEQMLIALICGGHALLEGVPGTGKTLAVRTLANLIGCEAGRVQFTPDLMPADIVGTNVYNMRTQDFDLRKGPIFTDLLLADEINRAPAKTQSALLEAMGERQVTIDGVRMPLSPIFSVFATQNPVEMEGTYPLPEAQQDRFILKIKIDHPAEDAERSILRAVREGRPLDDRGAHELGAVMDIPALLRVRGMLPGVRVEPGIESYLLWIVRSTRSEDALLLGAGTRGAIGLLVAAKARALLRGRDFVTPDDVVAMVEPVLAHRVVLTAEAEVSGERVGDVLLALLDRIDVPR